MDKQVYHINLLSHGRAGLWGITGEWTPAEVCMEASKVWANRKKLCPEYEFDGIEIVNEQQRMIKAAIVERKIKKAMEGRENEQ